VKKTYFDPRLVRRVRTAPRISNRFMPGGRHGAAYKSDGAGEEDDTRKEAELLEKIKTNITTQLSTRATKQELTDIEASFKKELAGLPIEQLRAMADDKTGVMAILTRQGLELARLQASFKEQPEDMSIRAQIKRWHEKEFSPGVKNIDQIGRVVEKRSKDMPALELDLRFTGMQFRAANSPMTPANTYGGSAYLPKVEYMPGIVDIIRVQPTFWDYLKKGSTSSAAMVWINKKVPGGSGGAAWLAPGVLKPGVSFTLDTQISNPKKIAASEKIAMELLKDIDGFSSWVEDELIYQVNIKATTTCLATGAPADANTPAGIPYLSVPFSGAALGLHTTNANNWDAILACRQQLKHANFNKGAITTFISPIDYGNMLMTKAQNQGQIFIPPATGTTIMEDNNIPVGYVLVAMLDYYTLLMYQSFSITYGWENDDFTKNLVTVIGEFRVHQIFSENHTGCFIYDTFANIIAALSDPTP